MTQEHIRMLGCLFKYVKLYHILHPNFKHDVSKQFDHVEGWIVSGQAVLLSLIANDLEGQLVEIGVWKGKSTNIFAYYSNNIKMYAVDTFEGSEEHKERLAGKTTLDEFLANTKTYGPKISVIKSDSLKAAGLFQDDSLDAIFIDADHSYEGVSTDIETWYPKLKKNGLMFGHDYPEPSENNQFKGLFNAVNEKVRDGNRFRDFGWWCGIWAAKKN